MRQMLPQFNDKRMPGVESSDLSIASEPKTLEHPCNNSTLTI